MASHRHLDQEPADTDTNSPHGRPPRPRWRRIGRIAAYAVLVLVVLVVFSAGLNFVLTQYERTSTAPYGQRVPVDGGSVDLVDHHEIAVPGGGHYLHWTRSPEIAARITSFLAQHDVAAREEAEVRASAAAV